LLTSFLLGSNSQSKPSFNNYNIMNLELTRDITMIGACLTVANDKNYITIWKGQPPTDFEADILAAGMDYEAILQKDALADAATGGAGDAKALAEAVLENATYMLARALANHFKKTGNLDALGKVDFNKTDIVRLRNQDLVDQSTAIRDLGTAAQAEPGAAGRGVTPARVAALTAAIKGFKDVMNNPRGQVVNRSTLKKEVETDVAALVTDVTDMDDLVLQFDGTDAGKRFIEAWKRARIIVDTGGGHSNTPTPPPAPATMPGK
jgi:hypothetical protein